MDMPAEPAPLMTIFRLPSDFPVTFAGIEESCTGDDGRTVLIVVKYRNIALFDQRPFNFKAARR